MEINTPRVITRAEAKAKGLPHYFTGNPCSRGHLDMRRTTHCRCMACDREDAVSKHRRNPDARKRRDTLRYQANRDAICAAARDRYHANREAIVERRRINREERNGEVRSARRAYVKRNKERFARYSSRYYRDNRDRFYASNAKRRAREVLATPPWFSEWDAFVIEEAYAAARRRGEAMGIPWDVDHMIPLHAKIASGLHVAHNIQVIPAEVNRSKRNRMIYTEPGQWLDFYGC